MSANQPAPTTSIEESFAASDVFFQQAGLKDVSTATRTYNQRVYIPNSDMTASLQMQLLQTLTIGPDNDHFTVTYAPLIADDGSSNMPACNSTPVATPVSNTKYGLWPVQLPDPSSSIPLSQTIPVQSVTAACYNVAAAGTVAISLASADYPSSNMTQIGSPFAMKNAYAYNANTFNMVSMLSQPNTVNMTQAVITGADVAVVTTLSQVFYGYYTLPDYSSPVQLPVVASTFMPALDSATAIGNYGTNLAQNVDFMLLSDTLTQLFSCVGSGSGTSHPLPYCLSFSEATFDQGFYPYTGNLVYAANWYSDNSMPPTNNFGTLLAVIPPNLISYSNTSFGGNPPVLTYGQNFYNSYCIRLVDDETDPRIATPYWYPTPDTNLGQFINPNTYFTTGYSMAGIGNTVAYEAYLSTTYNNANKYSPPTIPSGTTGQSVGYANPTLGHQTSYLRSLFFIYDKTACNNTSAGSPFLVAVNNSPECAFHEYLTSPSTASNPPEIGQVFLPFMNKCGQKFSPFWPTPTCCIMKNAPGNYITNDVTSESTSAQQSINLFYPIVVQSHNFFYHNNNTLLAHAAQCLAGTYDYPKNYCVDAGTIPVFFNANAYRAGNNGATNFSDFYYLNFFPNALYASNHLNWYPEGYSTEGQVLFTGRMAVLMEDVPNGEGNFTGNFTQLVTFTQTVYIPHGAYTQAEFVLAINKALTTPDETGDSVFWKHVNFGALGRSVIAVASEYEEDTQLPWKRKYNGARPGPDRAGPYRVGDIGQSCHIFSPCSGALTLGANNFAVTLSTSGTVNFTNFFSLSSPPSLSTTTLQAGTPAVYQLPYCYSRGPLASPLFGNTGWTDTSANTTSIDYTFVESTYSLSATQLVKPQELPTASTSYPVSIAANLMQQTDLCQSVGILVTNGSGNGQATIKNRTFNYTPKEAIAMSLNGYVGSGKLNAQFITNLAAADILQYIPSYGGQCINAAQSRAYFNPLQSANLPGYTGIQLLSLCDGSDAEIQFWNNVGFDPNDLIEIWTPSIDYVKPIDGLYWNKNSNGSQGWSFSRDAFCISNQSPNLWDKLAWWVTDSIGLTRGSGPCNTWVNQNIRPIYTGSFYNAALTQNVTNIQTSCGGFAMHPGVTAAFVSDTLGGSTAIPDVIEMEYTANLSYYVMSTSLIACQATNATGFTETAAFGVNLYNIHGSLWKPFVNNCELTILPQNYATYVTPDDGAIDFGWGAGGVGSSINTPLAANNVFFNPTTVSQANGIGAFNMISFTGQTTTVDNIHALPQLHPGSAIFHVPEAFFEAYTSGNSTTAVYKHLSLVYPQCALYGLWLALQAADQWSCWYPNYAYSNGNVSITGYNLYTQFGPNDVDATVLSSGTGPFGNLFAIACTTGYTDGIQKTPKFASPTDAPLFAGLTSGRVIQYPINGRVNCGSVAPYYFNANPCTSYRGLATGIPTLWELQNVGNFSKEFATELKQIGNESQTVGVVTNLSLLKNFVSTYQFTNFAGSQIANQSNTTPNSYVNNYSIQTINVAQPNIDEGYPIQISPAPSLPFFGKYPLQTDFNIAKNGVVYLNITGMQFTAQVNSYYNGAPIFASIPMPIQTGASLIDVIAANTGQVWNIPEQYIDFLQFRLTDGNNRAIPLTAVRYIMSFTPTAQPTQLDAALANQQTLEAVQAGIPAGITNAGPNAVLPQAKLPVTNPVFNPKRGRRE